MRLVSRLGLLMVIVSGLAQPAFAAGGDIAAGYSFAYDNDLSTGFPAGWFVSVGGNLTNVFGVVGSVTGNYKSESASAPGASARASLKVHTFLVGPRIMAPKGPARVYGQVLVGGANASAGVTATSGSSSISISDSTTNFCIEPGAGVDIDVIPVVGVRVGVAERFIRGSGETSKEFVVQAGVVVRFGK